MTDQQQTAWAESERTAASRWRDVLACLGDRLPDPLGSLLLHLADDSVEPWVDAEGRINRGR